MAASCAKATTQRSTRPARLRDESRRVVAALQARYAEETGIRALKIRHNNVLGYFVEVTAQHGDKSAGAAAQRRPSFTARRWPARCASPPPNWANWKPRSPAPPTARSGSNSRFSSGSLPAVIAQSAAIKECAEALGSLDVASALAHLAAERDYARPQSTIASISSSKAAAIRWWNRRWRATARRSSPMIAICRRRKTRRPAASG